MSLLDTTTHNDIMSAIFESDEAFGMIQRFIESLASQGVLELFISEDGLKKLKEKLIEEEALHDQYADLASSAMSVTTRYVYYYVHYLARIIYENGVGLSDDVSVWVKPLIEIDNDTIYGVHRFTALAEYAMSMKTVFVQAIDLHFKKLEFEFEHSEMNVKSRKNYWKKIVALKGEFSLLVDQAFPAGFKPAYKAKHWKIQKSDTFLRVNFEPVITSAPFKEIGKSFSDSKDAMFETRKTSSEIETYVLSNFKTLILEGVLEHIEKNGLRKTSNVINEVICILDTERPAYVNMRFVQAVYEFYRDDFAERQRQIAEAVFPNIPEFRNKGRWGNIVIPS